MEAHEIGAPAKTNDWKKMTKTGSVFGYILSRNQRKITRFGEFGIDPTNDEWRR